MSSIRIKNLQSASPLIEQQFNEMQFVVDLEKPDTTLKVSGEELKKAVGVQKHTHPIEDVDGLPVTLEKKFDKVGGTISGDLQVEGNARIRSLHVDEYLEVPELKYNRITATGNELWATDAAIVDEVWQDVDGVYLVTLKAHGGEQTVNFQYKDILRGIFQTTDENGTATGVPPSADSVPPNSDNGLQSVSSPASQPRFAIAYFEVTGIVDDTRFDCISLNGIAPQKFMTLVRQGNKTNTARQGSVYIDGLNKYLRVLDEVNSENIGQKNIKVQLGDLSGINHPVFGQLEGYGALLENAYICGRLVQRNPITGEDWAVGAVAVSGEQVFHFDTNGTPDAESITFTATEFGITSTEDTRTWQYKDGEQWVDIPNSNTVSLIVRHDDALWAGRLTLTLRYLALGTYFDIITITKLYDGEDALTVQILSDSGDNFINGSVATTLSATVWKGSRNITGTIPASLFSWQRTSADTTADIVWNSAHEGIGAVLTLTNADVLRKAVFECTVQID